MEQSPLTFLNQENTDSKLLVIIKNADISGKIHTVSHSRPLAKTGWFNTKRNLVCGYEGSLCRGYLFIVNCPAKMIPILENP